MCLDDVLGFINPETQMPNTVLLARVGWVCQREEAEVLWWLYRVLTWAEPSCHRDESHLCQIV